MAAFTALYDACVLYPAPLRDFLMHLALSDLVHARWTATIHEEWMAAVLADRPDLTRAQLERTRDLMNTAVPQGVVEGYQRLIGDLTLPDPDDRHVLAAAIQADASVIVTYNLRDFPAAALAPYAIEAQHPDTFLTALFDMAPGAVCAAAKRHRQRLHNPSKTVEEYLHALERQQLPETLVRLQRYAPLL